jgi:hypothetical protein
MSKSGFKRFELANCLIAKLVKIPPEAHIPEEKLTCYLLVLKERNDKSQFLAQAGFTQNNSETLRVAIALLIQSAEAVKDGTNEYGIFYRVDGTLQGGNGQSLAVITIWIQWYKDGSFHFVTLKPKKDSRRES